MTSIYEDKEDIKSNGLRKLLLQTNIQVIENSLFTKSTTQKREKMRVETKERRKFPINN